jgi:transposase-like protein
MRKSFAAAFKVKVAFAAVAGQRRITESASRYEVSAKQIHEWKK